MRITKSQSIVLTIFCLGLFFGVGIYFSHQEEKSGAITKAGETQTATVPTTSEGARFILNDFHRSETQNGKKLWEVIGKTGEYFPQNNSAKIREPQVWVFKQDDTITLTANEGVIHLSGPTLNEAEVRGNVIVTIPNRGIRINTEYAIYKKSDSTLIIPDFVKFTGGMFELSGYSLVGNLDTKQFILQKDVKSMIKGRGLSNALPLPKKKKEN